MPVRIRLQRHGRKGRPFYWIVAADSRSRRDGRYLEKLGTYDPNVNPAIVNIKVNEAVKWLENGAQPSDTARTLLSHKGVMLRHHLNKGVKKGALTVEQADKKFENWVSDKEKKIQDKIKNLLEDENFRVVVAALQDSISDWNFIGPTDENFEYQSYSVNANFVVSQNQDNFQLKIPIEAFLQGYKNGLFTVDELLLYSANTNSPFDKVRLNLNSIEVLYVEP